MLQPLLRGEPSLSGVCGWLAMAAATVILVLVHFFRHSLVSPVVASKRQRGAAGTWAWVASARGAPGYEIFCLFPC